MGRRLQGDEEKTLIVREGDGRWGEDSGVMLSIRLIVE
jgi:hypothetical protein